MSGGTPLTEERFVELFDGLLKSRLESMLPPILESMLPPIMESKLPSMIESLFDKKLAPIQRTLNEVYSFQQHESKAIESELSQVLKSDLKRKYPQQSIVPFQVKKVYDPKTGSLITDLDAAYLVKPILQRPDYTRLINAGLPLPTKPIDVSTSTRFVLAEAKHHLNRKKIAEKLNQFERIIQMFQEAKFITSTTDKEVLKYYTEEFINTVHRNKYFTEIDDYELYFGALYWEPSLINDLETDVEIYKTLCQEFATSSKKVEIYKKIYALEKKWYNPISNLTDEQIIALKTIDGFFGKITAIYPSGQRYQITDPEANTPVGAASLSLKGGRSKTKKNKASI